VDDTDDDVDDEDMLAERQWGGWDVRSECEDDQGTDCEDGDSDTDRKT